MEVAKSQLLEKQTSPEMALQGAELLGDAFARDIAQNLEEDTLFEIVSQLQQSN